MERRHTSSHLTVGMTASLTGRYSGPGRQARAGVEAWIADTNRAGGIRVRDRAARLPVCLLCYDDASQGQRGSALTERLIVTDRVDLLLGPYSSGLARRAAAVAERYQRVLWNHGGSSDAIFTAGYTWVVGLLAPASHYFHGVIDALQDALPRLQRVAIVHGTTGAFPREVAEGAAAYGRSQGFASVQTYPYTPETVDFTPLLHTLRHNPPQLLLGVGRIEDDLCLAVQMVRDDIRFQAVGLIVTPLQRFHTTLGPGAEGFLGPSQWEPGVVTEPEYGPSTADVMQSFRRHAPEDIDYPMAQAYAGCLVMQRCIEEAGSLHPRALRQAASQLNMTTFYGRYTIDPKTGRQLGHVMPVVQWQDGVKAIVWPPELRQQPCRMGSV